MPILTSQGLQADGDAAWIGELRRAAHKQSALPSVPLPASVVTAPVATTSTRRILWLSMSETNNAPPSELMATPWG